MPEGSIQLFSSYADTGRSRLSCTPICYHKQKGRDLLQNKVGPHSDFLEKNLVCLAQYRSKYTNRKTVDIWNNISENMLTRKKASLRNKNTLSCKCDQFDVDNFSLPVSLAAYRVVPIPFPRALTRSADLAFALSRCSPSSVPHI